MLPAAIKERRDKLVGMLGSQFEGEVLNALSLLKKMAAEHKIPIHELILSSPASLHGNVDGQLREAERRAATAEQRARDAEARARRAETAVQEQLRQERPAPALPEDWQERLQVICVRNLEHDFLSVFERDFAEDVSRRTFFFDPSVRQAAIIARILRKDELHRASDPRWRFC